MATKEDIRNKIRSAERRLERTFEIIEELESQGLADNDLVVPVAEALGKMQDIANALSSDAARARKEIRAAVQSITNAMKTLDKVPVKVSKTAHALESWEKVQTFLNGVIENLQELEQEIIEHSRRN